MIGEQLWILFLNADLDASGQMSIQFENGDQERQFQ